MGVVHRALTGSSRCNNHLRCGDWEHFANKIDPKDSVSAFRVDSAKITV